MAQNEKKLPQIALDGHWFPCHSGGEFGFLGDRILCDLAKTEGQPPKKLLFRPVDCTLEVDKLADITGLGLRAFATKTYDYALPSDDGKFKRKQFLQQDISGLITLRGAILKVVNERSPRKVWFLFYSACKALNTYGKTMGAQGLVRLQCPNSLAVDVKTGQIVLLDAEIRVSVLSDLNGEPFKKWFGNPGKSRNVKTNEAATLHSRALLLFFREVLGYLNKNDASRSDGFAQFSVQLDKLATAKSMQELQNEAMKVAEDWSIPTHEIPPRATMASPKQTTAAGSSNERDQATRSWLGWFLGSFLFNVFLVVLVLMLAGLFFLDNAKLPKKDDSKTVEIPVPIDGGKKPDAPALEDSSVQFSSYCVVFPARGTSSEKVLTALKQLYADKLLVPKQGESERSQFLSDRLDVAIKSFKEAGRIQKLLAQLNSDYSIRFNGFLADAEDAGLKSIIANGGLYRVSSLPEKIQHGSLLRANSVDKILGASGMEKQPEARLLLEELKNATREYASLKDAITIIGDRTAFILQVEPTAKAHEAVRKELLAGEGTPVFVPRPVFELFDAVDPAAGTGGGVARYRLKLDTKCSWRLVSSEDRKKTDYDGNETNAKMKWSSFAANQEIVWTTLPVLRNNGRTDNVSSFDIALMVIPRKSLCSVIRAFSSARQKIKYKNRLAPTLSECWD